MTMQSLLDTLLARDFAGSDCYVLAEWLPVWRAEQEPYAERGPFVCAVAASLRADRLAWAFFSGYQAAIQSAFADWVQPGSVHAFCVNESGRRLTDISSALHKESGHVFLRGSKSWVLANVADLTLFVLARISDGPPKGPGSLAVVRLNLQTEGVLSGPPRPQAVVPELPHTDVCFDAVVLEPEQVVRGDGYSDHAKPFRTREDVFVTGCVLAYLLAQARSGSWPTRWCQKCIAAISGLYSCSRLDLQDDRTHILVAGVLSLAGEVIRESDTLWLDHQATAFGCWRRDYPLLSQGKDARRQRATSSWDRIGWK
jgi:hypothetical protein